MTIFLNGAAVQAAAGVSLYEYLLQTAPPPETAYVLRNGSFISLRDYRDTLLAEGDRLSVYRIPSGG